MEVSAGFIVGFDNDDATIFEDQYRFIQDNGILLAMVGMLTAVPKTPLYERLEKAGRLRLDDPNCNIVPEQMTPQELQQGYWELLKRLYEPQAFFDRYFQVNAYPDFKRRRAEISIRANEGKALPTLVYGLAVAEDAGPRADQRAQLDDRRRGISKKLLSTQPAGARGYHRFRAIHEPLRDPLAFL